MAGMLIFIGSKNDSVFLKEGLKFLATQQVKYKVFISSVHREPKKTGERIIGLLKNKKLKVIIGGAATATGLPGFIAGYLQETNILIFGVRFTKDPGQCIIEDATFNLSSMPSGVPLAYAGFNEKGFLHACMLAVRALKQ
jgi:5-(carboxyamino)imidazole ribonucleotide mutase